MKLRSLNRLDASAKGLEEGIRRLGYLNRALGMPESILRAAAKDLEPMIRSMVRGNMSRAGVKTRTGTLARAVSSITVGISLSKARIAYGFPPGVKGYKNNPNFYEVAGSINYGAVRQPQAVRPTFDTVTGKVNRWEKRGALGEKAKRTLKAIAMGTKANTGTLAVRQNRLRASRTRTVDTTLKNPTAKSVALGGGIVVVKPKNFIPLTAAQKQVVRQQFVKNAARRLEAAARG